MDVRLRPRCAMPPPRPLSRIACTEKFSGHYLRFPGIRYLFACCMFCSLYCISLYLFYIATMSHWMIPSAAWHYWRLNDPCCSERDCNAAATLQRRLSMLLNGPDNCENCPFLLKDLHPILIHGFVGPPSLRPKRHVDRFSRFCTAHRI